MAILKHIASKSSNYGAALEYLIFKHDELRKTPILDQNGNRIMRDEFYLDGLNCEPYSFDAACQQLNREYQKNKNKDEIKSHHYIISFDPRDSTENCLTGKRAQELGLEYAKANFPGHQALVCTHMDGHNGGWMRKNRKSKGKDLRPTRQSFKHRNSLSGMPLPLLVRKQSRMKIFKTSCGMNMTFSSKPNVGVTAICRRNGTSSYRSVLWEKAAKENVWKDSLFRTQREISGTRKTPY